MEKPGHKTTEFILAAIATIVGVVLSSGLVSDNQWVQLLGAVQTGLASIGYTWGRSTVKRAEITARAVEAAQKKSPST